MEGTDPFHEWEKEAEKDKLSNLFVIERDGILKDYEEKDIKKFVYDLHFVFDILGKLNDNYGDNDSHIERDLKKFKRLIDDWNIKYKDVLLDLKFETVEISLKVIFKQDSLADMKGLIKNMNHFDKFEDSDNENEMTAVFDIDNKENTLTLREQDGKIRLVYLRDDMLDPRSPEFRICAYFALKGGFDKTKNLLDYNTEFSFDFNTSKDDWYKTYANVTFSKWYYR